MKQRNLRQEKGITLIALVITIIVMLILVGVTISIAINGGLFNYAKQASSGYNTGRIQEEFQAGIYGLQMSYYQNAVEGSLRDYIFSNAGQALLEADLGENNLEFDAENNEITYKGIIFEIAENGAATIVGGTAIPETNNGGNGNNNQGNTSSHPTSMTIVPEGNVTEIEEGDTLQLSVATVPTTITDTIEWSSSAQGTATISNSGLVTGVEAGTTTITATAVDGEETTKTATITITVVEPLPAYSASLLNANGFLTENAKYTDTNSEVATIPKGYKVSETSGEQTIATGLVIKDNSGNEFVWVPLPGRTMKVATYSDGYYSNRYGSEPKSYTDLDNQEYLRNYYGNLSCGNIENYAYETHYIEMATSANRYKGFYIGRYEATKDNNNQYMNTGRAGSMCNTQLLTNHALYQDSDTTTHFLNWWGLYYESRRADVAENGTSVQTSMIWGQQLDKLIAYLDSNNISHSAISSETYTMPESSLASGQATYTNKSNNADVISDKIFNIYDLRGNLMEYTAGSHSSGNKNTIDGNYSNNKDFTSVKNCVRTYSSDYVGTRLSLYIK